MYEKLGIIILNYNNASDTIECLDSLFSELGESNARIIVVDNKSQYSDVELLEKKYGDSIEIIKSPKNYGYAKGNNIGIEYAKKLGLEYLCVLNNDAKITDNFFREYMDFLDNHKDVAFISPAIVDDKITVQNTGGTINLLKGTSYFYNSNIPFTLIKDKIIECKVLYGTCMLFKTSILDEVGNIPEAYFMFYEETEWCYRAINKGLKCISLTTHYVIHKGSASIKKINGLQEYLMERNKVVFVKRNATRSGYILFLFFNAVKTIYRGCSEKVPVYQYFKYHIDGMSDRIDKRFPFVWINTDN